jgi:hypothetical protein
MKRNRPTLSTSRGAGIFEEMIGYRRNFCADTEFFLMPEIWEDLCDEEGRWTIKLYHTPDGDRYRPKAGIVSFDDRVILSVDERLMAEAKRGCNLSNFILAHEFAHLALGHHDRSATTKNFRLKERSTGPANVPPTDEELETDFAAVCFQCGVSLLESGPINPLERWRAA